MCVPLERRECLDVWVWNDWDKNVRTTQNQYAYTISLVSKLLCATACWSSNARRRWCSGSICQEALPCSCWASCLRWQQKLPVYLQRIKKLSSSKGNHFPIEDFEHSSETCVNDCSYWTGKVMNGGLEATIAPEIHNVAFCTSNSVHELLSCGLWGETYGKKKVLQKGVLRLLCLRICLPSANPLTMLEAIPRIWNKEIQRYIICDQFAFHMRIGIDSIDSSTEQQNSNLCALRWQLYFSTPQCGNHQTIALREKFHFSFQFI